MQPDGRYHIKCKMPLKRQRATTIKIRSEEYFADTNWTAGLALETLAIDAGVKPGVHRLPPAFKATAG
jgi:hypothetical protein